MTVAEVKEILQGAGVNLNDAQFAAIQSLLGSGGGGGSDVDIMNVTNGASVELLTDSRIWFESLCSFNNYSINDVSLADYHINDLLGNQFVGNLRFHFSDENREINPFDTTNFSDKPFPDALRVSADKIPYVIDLLQHRFLDVNSSYGNYAYPNYLHIIYMSDPYNSLEPHYYDSTNYNILNNDTDEPILPSVVVKVYNCYRKFISIDNMISGTFEEYTVMFINFDNEVFPNGEMVWIPFIGHNTQQGS